MQEALVPERTCGPCTVCCTALTIDQPELQKLPGERCPNCVTGSGCTVYETRGTICRTWFCGWRRFKWISAKLRPDTSGILVRLGHEDVPPPFKPGITIEFAVLNRAGLFAEGLVEAVAAAVRANFATFLIAVPVTTGVTSTRLLLNVALEKPVAKRDKAAALHVLQETFDRGHKAPHRPVILFHRPPQPGG